MKFYVDELPKSKIECPFYSTETNECKMVETECNFEECKCFVPLVVVVDEVEEVSEFESDNQEI